MASTYTFVQKAPAVEPGQESLFGNMVNDGSHNAMLIGAGPQTVDISASPIVSPATISNTGVTTLTVPLNAAQVSFLATSNSVNISESDDTVATNYFTIPTGTQVTVDVTRVSKLYLKANAGSATLSFYFNVV